MNNMFLQLPIFALHENLGKNIGLWGSWLACILKEQMQAPGFCAPEFKTQTTPWRRKRGSWEANQKEDLLQVVPLEHPGNHIDGPLGSHLPLACFRVPSEMGEIDLPSKRLLQKIMVRNANFIAHGPSSSTWKGRLVSVLEMTAWCKSQDCRWLLLLFLLSTWKGGSCVERKGEWRKETKKAKEERKVGRKMEGRKGRRERGRREGRIRCYIQSLKEAWGSSKQIHQDPCLKTTPWARNLLSFCPHI